MDERPFWESKRLAEMTPVEWESLCDGCGLCCLIRLEDEETGEVTPTRVACRLFDAGACRCRDYSHRHARVPDCLRLTPDNVGRLSWLPASCAYRLIDEGRPLPPWHPLITGDPESVHAAGVSVRGQTVSEAALESEEDALDFIARDLSADRSRG